MSEPACFGAAPAPGIFYSEPALAPAPGNREQIFEFLKTDYELSNTRTNTCPSTSRSFFMFTLEKISNNVKFHVIFVNY